MLEVKILVIFSSFLPANYCGAFGMILPSAKFENIFNQFN